MSDTKKSAAVSKLVPKQGWSSIKYTSAPSPAKKAEQIKLTFSADLIQSIAKGGWHTDLMQIWALIQGERPPVNCIGYHEKDQQDIPLVGLKNAHALFLGLERPCKSHDNGEDVHIYVTKADQTYEYIPHMVCVARRVPLSGKLLTVYVRLSGGWEGTAADAVKGEIIGWDLVKASEHDKYLPSDHASRYRKQVW